MTQVLLTGGSGFIASHCLKLLLSSGHCVVTTVRSKGKGRKILDTYPTEASEGRVAYAIVEDIAEKGAFEQTFQTHPSITAVIHTASPFHFNAKNLQQEMLDPAVRGTRGILEAIQSYGKNVTKLVVTSSMAAMLNFKHHPKVYNDTHWNPITTEEALSDPRQAYLASKTFAEKAVWEFVTNQRPRFNVTTICPPLVFGPVLQPPENLDSINTSNSRLVGLIRGEWTAKLPPTGTFLWADVRDVAQAHVRALSVPDADNQRFLLSAPGPFSNADIATIVKQHFSTLRDKLPADYQSDLPKDMYGADSGPSQDILDLNYFPLEKSIVDSITSLLRH